MPNDVARPLTQRVLLAMISQVLPESQVGAKELGEIASYIQSGAWRAYWLVSDTNQKAGFLLAQPTVAGAQRIYYIAAMMVANSVLPSAWVEAFDAYIKPEARELGCTHVQFDSTPDNKGISAIGANLGASVTLRYTVEL